MPWPITYGPDYALTFLLPQGTRADSGTHQPSPDGCRMRLDWPLVEIQGPSRQAVFEHAGRLIRLVCRDQAPLSIPAILLTPIVPASRDAWSIIVGAEVAFSPTPIDPYFPGEARPPPGRAAARRRA